PSPTSTLFPYTTLFRSAFWDETVKPDHTYQYKVKVEFVNPTYQSQWGLANPDMKKEPTLSADWVQLKETINIHSDLAFYVMGPRSEEHTSELQSRSDLV